MIARSLHGVRISFMLTVQGRVVSGAYLKIMSAKGMLPNFRYVPWSLSLYPPLDLGVHPSSM